jgi:SHS2 domain-containing protein
MNIQLTIHLPEAIQKILTAVMVKDSTEKVKESTETAKKTEGDPTEQAKANDLKADAILHAAYRHIKFRDKTIRGLLIDHRPWFVLNDILDALDCEGLIFRDCITKAVSDYSMECELEGEGTTLVDRFGVFVVIEFSRSEKEKAFSRWFSRCVVDL